MKRILTVFLAGCLSISGVFAQSQESLKPQVLKPVYFDVSPPLRDMAKTAPTKVDCSWKDGVVKNNHYPFGFPKEEPISAFDQTLQNYFGSSNGDSVLVSFDGVSNIDNLFPPDTDGDVGPSHYFQVVNLHYSIFDKAGNKLIGPLANSNMFTGLPHNSNDGDAVVLYDEVENRWIFTQFSLPTYPNGPFWEMVAVSQTGDPLGSWYRYQFQFTDMPDYPKLGVWPDGIYMTTNRFSSGATNYIGTGAACFNKAAMYAGSPTAEMVFFTLPSSNEAYAVLPSDCDGDYPPAGTPNFFAWLKSGHIRIYAFQVDWTNPANSTYSQLITLPVSSYNGTVSGVPQKNTSTQLDAISGRLMFRLPFRKFSDHWSMVCNSTVNVSGHAGIRWWELRNDGSAPGNWSVYQESTYSPDNNYRWMGSIAMDAQGNIALGYSVSSSSMFPAVRYAGRLANDPINTFSVGETSIIDGGGSQTSTYGGRSRWGDYSACNADPSTPGKFWYTQEYYTTTSAMGWKTRIGSFTLGNILVATPTALPNPVCLGDSTHLDVLVSGGTGSLSYTWTSNPPGFNSAIKNPGAKPLVSTYYICSVTDGTNTVTDSVLVTVKHTTSNAGNDTIVCYATTVVPVHGSGTNFDQSIWQTTGTGTFASPTALNTTYTPSAEDKAAHEVGLIFTVHSMAPCTGLVNDTMKLIFNPCPGISDLLAQDLRIMIVPNPSNGVFDLSIENIGKQDADVIVTDIQGHQVFSKAYHSNSLSLKDHLNLGNLPKGSYIMKVVTETRTQVQKLIIQ